MSTDWMGTYTGRQFFPFDPDPASFTIFDIAHALSHICRFNGHTDFHYSVAQHCCLLAAYADNVLDASPIDCLQTLMHDAPEAYLCDIVRPVKKRLPDYREAEKNIEHAMKQWLHWNDVM